MTHKTILSLVAIITAIVVPTALGIRTVAQEPIQEPTAELMNCTIPFRVATNTGSSQGTAFEGNLVIEIDSWGELQGYLETDDATSIPMVGQMVQQAISLILELEASEASMETRDGANSFGTIRNSILEDTDCDVVLREALANPSRPIGRAGRDLVHYPAQVLS